MFFTAIFRGEELSGYTPRVYAIFLAMAIIPQMLGHSILNYALKFLPATMISMALLGEPIGSTILAILFLKEIPSMMEIIGGILILIGILIAILPASKTNAV
ncbi:MAG TPA: EamA family transporter [Anaerolineaceae bacterium]|nr:EamA family transporter [Anaerolineaceae bacterium]